MILGPDPLEQESGSSDLSSRDFAGQVRRAVIDNLWPKMTPIPGAIDPPMDISLEFFGEVVDIRPEDSPAIRDWTAGLNAIRSWEMGDRGKRFSNDLPISVDEVLWYGKVIGHLAIVRRFRNPGPAVDIFDPNSGSSRNGRLALMRGQTELIVSAVDWISSPDDGELDYLAVYKASPLFDALYAESEPPAHDSWSSSAGSKEASRLIAHTKKRIRAVWKNYFQGPRRNISDSGDIDNAVLARASRSFSSFLPSDIYVIPRNKSDHRRLASQPRKRLAERGFVVDARRPWLVGTDPDGNQTHEVIFCVNSDEVAPFEISMAIFFLGVDALKERIEVSDDSIVWTGAIASEGPRALISPGEEIVVTVKGLQPRAISFEFEVVGGSLWA